MKNKIVGIILFVGFASLFWPLLPALMSNIAIIGMFFATEIKVWTPYTTIACVLVFGMIKFANKN